MRPVITQRDIESKRYQPRIAIIDGTQNKSTQRVLELIKKAGGKPMIIPRQLSDRLLKSVNLTDKDIATIKAAKSREEVANYDSALQQATKMHLQYITRKLTYVDAVILPGSHYDINPSLFHDTEPHADTHLAPPVDVRFETEMMMTDYALHTRKVPLLGIASGMHLLVVRTGGRLTHEFNEQVSEAARAKAEALIAEVNESLKPVAVQARRKDAICMVRPQSILGVILKDRADLLSEADFNGEALGLSDEQHQGVALDDVNARELNVVAITPSNVVEAVEHRNHPFCLGVHFHPEHDAKFNLGLEMIKQLVNFARDTKLPLKAVQPGQAPEHFLDWYAAHEVPTQKLHIV